uniref:Uncharacterized protein n=1 Tax=Globodera rostochiensis TaxID=31243 RepID=A0A914I661_GLORO
MPIFCIDQDIRLSRVEVTAGDSFSNAINNMPRLTEQRESAVHTFDQLMARRENRFRAIRRQKQRKKLAKQIDQKPKNGAYGTAGRVLLSNERGLERSSVIVVPVDQPKVLTAETFVTGRSRRIHGQVERKNPSGDVPFIDRSTAVKVKEVPMAKRFQIVTGTHTTNALSRSDHTNTVVDEPIARLPADSWKLPPALLAGRLRRFNKADIVRGFRQRALRAGVELDGDKLRTLMRQIDIMRRDDHQRQHLDRRTDTATVPSMSFLIDDDSYHRTVDIDGEKPKSNMPLVVKPNLRTKFPKNRESAKPIKADESDMDLLHPTASGIAELKQYRKFSETQHVHTHQHQHPPLPSHASPSQPLPPPQPTTTNHVPIQSSTVGVPPALTLPSLQRPLSHAQKAAPTVPTGKLSSYTNRFLASK